MTVTRSELTNIKFQGNVRLPDTSEQKRKSRRLLIILVIIYLALAAGIILNSASSYNTYARQTREHFEKQLVSISTLKAARLTNWYQDRYGNMETLTTSPGLPILLKNLTQNPADQTLKAELMSYLNNLIVYYGFVSYLVCDAQGQVLLSFRETDNADIIRDHELEIAEAYLSRQAVFHDFHLHESQGPDDIMLAFIAPFFDPDSDQPLGAIIAMIDPFDFLYPYLTEWPVPSETAETLLIRVEDDHILFLNPLRFIADAALNLRIPLTDEEILGVKLALGQTGIAEGLDYRNQEVIGFLSIVEGTPWRMVSRIDIDEFIAPIEERRQRAFFTSGALLVLVFAALLIIWRGQQVRFLRIVYGINQELEQRVEERTAQLEATKNELEAFAYSVSHDLRAPLRAMSGFSKLLEEEFSARLGEKGQHYIDRIQTASIIMGELIDDLLTLSRVTRSDFTYSQIEISGLVSEIMIKLQETEPELQVSLKIEEGLTARGDQKLLAIALENLLSNAWKFSSRQPLITIEFGCSSNDYKQKTFYIRDNGTGFNMDYADKLFIPFQRLHRVDEFPGSGIGLSIVYRIIERHGGKIWAESAVGNGSTFYFTLPER